jgi:peptidoglycan/xylan/chitin deacetylase (PgdA/CDA1 family)
VSGGRQVAILSYHDVSPNPHPAFRRYSATVREFERQMRWLSRRSYTAIDLDAFISACSARSQLPPRSVIITFDDGFRSCAEHAVPVLQAHGFTAVFYLVTGLMGATSRWMADVGVNLPLMGWSAARQLAAAGYQCGVHTMSHPRLTTLDAKRRRIELADARKRAEDELGREISHFAYPYGALDAAVRESVAAAGYVTACSTSPRLAHLRDDPLALPRLTMHGGEPLVSFGLRIRTGRGIRQTARTVLKRLLSRPAHPSDP